MSLTIKLHQAKTRWPSKRAQNWHFTIHAANGRTLATSEKYTNKQDAIDAARLVATNQAVIVTP